MSSPEFVVIGHVVLDAQDEGWRLGGTAAFAAVQAQRLGVSVGVVTRAGSDVKREALLPGVQVAGRPSTGTTRFENVYERGQRRQRVLEQADPVTEEDVPEDWRRAPVMLVGPVCGEVPAELSGSLEGGVTGVSAQGWLRRVDRERRVRRRAWTGAPFWSKCEVLFVSDEDLGRRWDQLGRWEAEVRVVVVTRARRGVQVYEGGRWRSSAAFPAREVDPTGAGDIFAGAFLVRYRETGDLGEATRFASAASACGVEEAGVKGVATRKEIERRMAAHPEIVLT